MSDKICEINISNNWLTDTYIFYEDESILRIYNHNSINHHLKEWIEPQKITRAIKNKIVTKCLEKHKDRIMDILDYL